MKEGKEEKGEIWSNQKAVKASFPLRKEKHFLLLLLLSLCGRLNCGLLSTCVLLLLPSWLECY